MYKKINYFIFFKIYQTVKALKNNYYKGKFYRNYKNNKETWDTVKELCNIKNKRVNASPLLNLATSPNESLDTVNQYFTTIGEKLAADILMRTKMSDSKLVQNTYPSENCGSMCLFPTDFIEIDKIILNLKNNSAPGIDSIPTKILKNSHAVLCTMIAHLCNLSFSTGSFPAIFKKAVVVPIYKGGGVDSVSNYRPISLLSTISKIIEKAFNTRLIKYLECRNILADTQYGFRNGRNTEDAVSKLSELVSKALDKGERCVGIFLDLKIAFDTVSIPLLLSKLENMGIRGPALEWLADYLTGRSQVVRVGDVFSSSSTVTYGIPQGSTLGPTLFLAYVNDLCNIKLDNGSVLAFADDTALIFKNKTWPLVEISAENGLRKVIKWLDDNLLTINVQKTKYICFRISGATNPPTDFIIRAHSAFCDPETSCDCEFLLQTENIKYLGIIVDKNLNWHPQILALSKRIRKLLPIFRHLRDAADPKLIIRIYYALCQSLLTYCVTVWGGAATSYLLTLERAQRALIKVMFFKPRRYPTKKLYEETQLLTVRQLFIYNSVLRYHQHIDPTKMPQGKRRVRTLVPTFNTMFVRHQIYYMSPFLYRYFNDTNNIIKLNRNRLKLTLKNSLITLNYDETEHILNIK